MINKILIANRGEIACRIIRTCHEMGIATAAVYSEADRNSLHVELADEAIYLGGNTPQETYTNIEKIISAAQRVGAGAVHPGYGFLAENVAFAQAAIDANLNFIGPSPAAIKAVSNKKSDSLRLQGVPTLSSYSGNDQSDTALIKAANKIGYPIMIKAAAHSKGKGLWEVDSAENLPAKLISARQIAKQALGDNTLLLERMVPNARHIEVQIFGDKLGNVIAIGERECNIQRRYQPVIEESPSTLLPSRLRSTLFEIAVGIGTHLDYYSAGTVKFLVDESLHFYFIGMNTCLPIAHAITEETTGFDLVRWQIMVAEGFPLTDMDVYPAGHAIEARIYAEEPSNNFQSSSGEILHWHEPAEVRVDSGIRDGDVISENCDPLLAKVTAYGEHRQGAIRRLDYALSKYQVLGVNSNIDFLRRILMHPEHLEGNVTTDFIMQHPELITDELPIPVSVWIAAAIAKSQSSNIPTPLGHVSLHYFKHKQIGTHIALTAESPHTFTARISNQVFTVNVGSYRDGEMTLTVDNHRQKLAVIDGNQNHWWVHVGSTNYDLTWLSNPPDNHVEISLYAPTHGHVRAIHATVGQHVKTGDVLMTLQASNTEHFVTAPYHGEVLQIHQCIGTAVQAETLLLDLRPIIR